ncbi:choline transport protein [Trichophyton mentagrophytes]|nr:choline transport protein [Trichophyton mentagrophytes]
MALGQSEEKIVSQVENHPVNHYDGEAAARPDQDAADMARLGVAQETKRRFGLVTILGFTTCIMGTWESGLPFFLTAYINGGPVTMVYGFILAFFGSLATCASLAEMASMYPISGGQYYWASLLAPPGKVKFLSFLTGWLSVLGWQSASTTGTYLGGTIIQGVVKLNYPEYTPERWQATLMLYAVLILSLSVNVSLVKWLPGVEGVILIIHVVGFFAIMIPLVHLAPISSAKFVFTEFINTSGYSSSGLSWLIGQSASAVLFIGYDGACHMAEEVQNARINVPRAMFFTMFINGAMGLAMYLVILFCIGDIDKVINTETKVPFIELFRNSTQSNTAATVLTSLLITTYIVANFNFMASASRQAWAFARDGGLPFSHLLRKIDRKRSIPLFAIALTGVLNSLLGLISIGSNVAFSAVVSLVVSGYMSSYVIVICVMIHRRLTHGKIEFGPWNLGRYGLPINIIAVIYTTVTVIFAFFPPSVPVNAENMNYSGPVYGVVVAFGIVYYIARGHKTYTGPKLPRNGL